MTLIKLLIAGDAPVHGALGVKTKEITSLLEMVTTGLLVEGLNVTLFALGIFNPFFRH